MSPKNLDILKLDVALENLVDQISTREIPIATSSISSFDNFVQDIFSLSYPQYSFKSWHIRKICAFVDEVLTSESKMALAVLPRYHLKSTILGEALSIYRMLVSFGDGLYVSYKDELVVKHLSDIKEDVRRNPKLATFMFDLSPRSESNISYRIGSKRVRMFGSGIFAMKRGLHTDLVVVVDDILGTLENPMMLGDLEKAERMFNQEVLNIPNKNCPLIAYGTTIHHEDLLFKLKDNPQFKVLWLPAINPDPDHEVLWEDVFDKKTLEMKKAQQGWRSFSSEFLLQPIMAAKAFFSREELDKVIDQKLTVLHRMFMKLDKGNRHVVVGVDIGKRRNPSHIAVFVDDEDGNLIMIYQEFWDQMDYTEQVFKINTICENFQVDKLYWDATRGEMEERGLARQCVPIKFTGRGQRSQASYATDFAKRVETKTIKLVDNDRFISQILAVTSDLKALDTPMGHGDSFWSVALAIGAYEDFYSKDRKMGFSDLGNITDLIRDRRIVSSDSDWKNSPVMSIQRDDYVCKICNKRGFLEKLSDGRTKCNACFCVF